MSVPDRRDITNSLVAMLTSAVAVPVGDHQAPVTEAQQPWVVVYSVPGGQYDGSLQYPESDAQFAYRIESVGRNREQCEWCADNVRRTMLARSSSGGFQVSFPDTSPWLVNDRRPEGNPGGVVLEGSPTDRVFSFSEHYIICATPS